MAYTLTFDGLWTVDDVLLFNCMLMWR